MAHYGPAIIHQICANPEPSVTFKCSLTLHKSPVSGVIIHAMVPLLFFAKMLFLIRTELIKNLFQ